MDRTCCTTLCTCPALPGLPYCKRCTDDAVEMGLLSSDDIRTTSIRVSGGTEEQNAWASDIASAEIAKVNREIETARERNARGDRLERYLDELIARRETLINGFARTGAKQLIDMHAAGRANVADALINLARSACK